MNNQSLNKKERRRSVDKEAATPAQMSDKDFYKRQRPLQILQILQFLQILRILQIETPEVSEAPGVPKKRRETEWYRSYLLQKPLMVAMPT